MPFPEDLHLFPDKPSLQSFPLPTVPSLWGNLSADNHFSHNHPKITNPEPTPAPLHKLYINDIPRGHSMQKTVYIWGPEDRYSNYRLAVESAGGRTVFGLAHTGQAERWDALLLPGGGDMEPWRYEQENTASHSMDPDRDAAELSLLSDFTAAGKPILGICRGLQVINVFFGGTLLQHIPGHNALPEGDRLHRVQTAPSPLRTLLGNPDLVNSAHHQAADRLGSGLRAVQWAGDGVIEALCHDHLPVWAVQWHPERLKSPVGQLLFTGFLDLIS